MRLCSNKCVFFVSAVDLKPVLISIVELQELCSTWLKINNEDYQSRSREFEPRLGHSILPMTVKRPCDYRHLPSPQLVNCQPIDQPIQNSPYPTACMHIGSITIDLIGSVK